MTFYSLLTPRTARRLSQKLEFVPTTQPQAQPNQPNQPHPKPWANWDGSGWQLAKDLATVWGLLPSRAAPTHPLAQLGHRTQQARWAGLGMGHGAAVTGDVPGLLLEHYMQLSWELAVKKTHPGQGSNVMLADLTTAAQRSISLLMNAANSSGVR